MSVDIRLKHSAQAGRVPDAGSLKSGEVAINTRDVKAYIKNADGQVVQIAGADNPTTDGRYLRIDSGAGAQTVQSTDDTKFEGLIDADGGVRVGIRGTSTVVTGLGVVSDVLRINKDSKTRIGIGDTRTTVYDPFRVQTELDSASSTTNSITSRVELANGEHDVVHFSSSNNGFDTYATSVKTFEASFNGVKPSGDEK